MSRWRNGAAACWWHLPLLLIVLSFLPLWQTDRWWVRQWDFPRLQVAGLLLIVGGASCSSSLGALALAIDRGDRCRTGLAGQPLRRLFPALSEAGSQRRELPGGRQISLLNANVLLTNKDYGELLALVEQRKPDMLLLLEPGAEWEKAVEPLHGALSVSIIRSHSKYLWNDLAVALADGGRHRVSAPARRSVGACLAAAGRRASRSFSMPSILSRPSPATTAASAMRSWSRSAGRFAMTVARRSSWAI